jgi:hypothetical protein
MILLWAKQRRPSFLLEPGGGPTVAFAQDAALDTIYGQAIQRTLLWVALAGVVGGTVWALIDSRLGGRVLFRCLPCGAKPIGG